MARNIELAQALFGYSEGHRLIASSIPMDPHMRHFLAYVTDGSGPGKYNGFEASCSGLPVPNSSYYALFMTWPAPEMPRPGCVWSHLVLLDTQDLAQIPDLSILQELFLQPKEGWKKQNYETALRLPIGSRQPVIHQDSPSHRRAALLLSSLYGRPENDLVILDDTNAGWTHTLLATWSQQWSSLRSKFSFSSGSLGDRRSSGTAFDVQIAPLNSQRLWQREQPKTLVLDGRSDSSMVGSVPWLHFAMDDLLKGVDFSPLRQFLHKYGVDVPASRAAFSKLAEHCYLIRGFENVNPAARLEHLALAFAKPEDALQLKRDEMERLLGADSRNHLEALWAATYFLLKEPSQGPFSHVPVELFPQLDLLWANKRTDVLALLGTIQNSDRAATFERDLSHAIRPTDLPLIWREQPEALYPLVGHNPLLAAQPDAWRMPVEGQSHLWGCIAGATQQEQIWASVSVAMIAAGCSIREAESATLSGDFMLAAISNWLERGQLLALPTERWRLALRPLCERAIHYESLNAYLLAFAAWALPAYTARGISAQRADVQHLAASFPIRSLGPLALPTHFWLVALGLRTTGSVGLSLLSKSYFEVYDAVVRSNYANEWWDLLDPVVPSYWWVDWNRAYRLRVALLRWLQHEPIFAATALVRAAPREYAHFLDEQR